MAGWAGDSSFDVFRLPEEHDELRRAIRALAEKIAPHAAAVDEEARFPQEALDALNASGFNAVHVPEEYGGQGADSVAACIVIEEVARVDASAVADPGGQQAGHHGPDPARLRRAEAEGAARRRLGRGDGFYALSERRPAVTPRRCRPRQGRW